MRIRRAVESLAIVLIVAISVLWAVPAAQAATVAGTVDTIDLAKKKITIEQSDGSSITLGVKSWARISRNSTPTTLSGLALRDSITARHIGLTAVKLSATGPAVTTASGAIAGMSTGTGVITLGSTSLLTNANTKIARNGKVVSLGKLTLSDTAVVHLAPGTNVAQDVVANGPEETEVEGTISAINGDQVTITPEEGGAVVTVTVDTSTLIEVGGEPATLQDLQTGQNAEVEYDPTTLVAFSIEVDIPDQEEEGETAGTVAAVDVGAGTLTITPDGGGANVVLTVTAATEIEVNGEDATLADIQVGMPVKAEFDTATMVATEIKAGSEECDDDCGSGSSTAD